MLFRSSMSTLGAAECQYKPSYSITNMRPPTLTLISVVHDFHRVNALFSMTTPERESPNTSVAAA